MWEWIEPWREESLRHMERQFRYRGHHETQNRVKERMIYDHTLSQMTLKILSSVFISKQHHSFERHLLLLLFSVTVFYYLWRHLPNVLEKLWLSKTFDPILSLNIPFRIPIIKETHSLNISALTWFSILFLKTIINHFYLNELIWVLWNWTDL